MTEDFQDDGSATGRWVTGAAVVTAVLASSCCILPLFLGGAGISALGLAASFETTRPYLLIATTLLLGGGFYYNYFRKPDCAPGDACEAPRPRLRRFNRAVLWLSTAAVIAFAMFPSYASIFTNGETPATSAYGSVSSQQIVLQVDGMTCEACAVTVQNELADVPGVLRVAVDFGRKEAVVIVQADAPPDDSDLLSAVARAGYSATVSPTEGREG